jgi:opacity protein-like surface antigen
MKYAILLLLTTIISFSTFSVSAQDYYSVGAGASFWNQTHNSDELEGGSEPGPMVFGTIGREYGSSYRLELDLQYSRNQVHGINDPDNGFKSTGDGNVIDGVGLFMNGAYDFRPGKNFRPYVIAGAGVMYLKVSESGNADTPLDDDSFTYGAQVGFGARFDVTKSIRVDLGARQIFAASTKLDGLNSEYDTTTFTLAAVMKF